MTVPRRERLREAAREEIKTIARRHMTELGTAGISLRSIARDMGMTATALYRYFGSRDDLITDLILDAYHALADAFEAASASLPATDYVGRLFVTLLRYREWALEHPTDFQLIFGNPIPGYHAPHDSTLEAASRVNKVILVILTEALEAGKLHPQPEYEQLSPALTQPIVDMSRKLGDISPVVLYLSMAGWTKIHGMVMLELFHHTTPIVGDTGAFYRHEALNFMRDAGMENVPTA